MKKRTLLIVDDEPDLCEIMVDLLSDEGFECFAAHSAAEALATVSSQKDLGQVIDLIISDLNMPGGSGISLLKDLRSRGFKTPFFFLTGDLVENELRHYYSDGVLGYQLKPFQAEEFIKKIQSLPMEYN
ncbi:MAG: hypothetical protein RJB66_1438 [Pseudomonadota bacterium]|jgi:CheY-like chemotaxis protein